MTVRVQLADGEYRIGEDWGGTGAGNAFLAHLAARAFSPATIRAYAFDVVNLARFLTDQGLGLAQVTAADVFAWLTGRAPAVTARPVPGRSWRCGRGPLRRPR